MLAQLRYLHSIHHRRCVTPVRTVAEGPHRPFRLVVGRNPAVDHSLVVVVGDSIGLEEGSPVVGTRWEGMKVVCPFCL